MKNRAHVFLLCNVIYSFLVSGGISAMEQEPIEQAGLLMNDPDIVERDRAIIQRDQAIIQSLIGSTPPIRFSPDLPEPESPIGQMNPFFVMSPVLPKQEHRQVAAEQDSLLCNVPYNVLCRICKYLVTPSKRLFKIFLMQDYEIVFGHRDPEKEAEYLDEWKDMNTLMLTCRYFNKIIPQIMKDNHQGFYLDFGEKRKKDQSSRNFLTHVFQLIKQLAIRYENIPFDLNLSSNRLGGFTISAPSFTSFNKFLQQLADAGIAHRIEILHMCQNKFVFLPKNLSFLTNLKALNFNNNYLLWPKGLLPLTELTSLEDLELRRNALFNFLPEMAKLINLKYLDASECHGLRDAPIDVLASLKRLSAIDLSYTDLTYGQIGAAFGKEGACPSLRSVVTNGLLEYCTEEEQQYLAELRKRGVSVSTT